MNNLNKKTKVIFKGKTNEYKSKILPDSWEMLYISHSGDNSFGEGYTGSFSIPRVNLEITGSLTIFEYFGGDHTDWFTLKYSNYSRQLSIENARSSDNDVVISVL